MVDNFDKARESLWGLTGFQVKRSTIVAAGWSFIPQATWIVETINTDDGQAILLQWIGADGGQRMVIPDRVAQAIYRHHDQIMKGRRVMRAQKAVETRQRKASQAEPEEEPQPDSNE